MQKSSCSTSYPNTHVIMLMLSVIIKPVQPTHHHINIHMPTSMTTHVANPKANANSNTWRMMWAGGGKT